jgi:amino acid adenylation domain-containing protein
MAGPITPEERALLEQRLASAPPARNGSIPRLDPEVAAPLSFAQTRLWFFDQLLPRSPLYNISFAAQLRFPLDLKVFKRALDTVVDRHEVLRTTFALDGEEPVQLVQPTVDVPVTAADLRRVPPERRGAEVERLAARFQQEPFDLATGPLIRVLLVWLGASDYLLVVGVHHIVADGWSLGVFARELEAAYEAIARGREADLAELEIQYRDFSAWQRTWLSGDRLDRELDYWRGRLDSLPVLELPVDKPRPPVQMHRGADVTFTIPQEVAGSLAELGRGRGATLFMVLLACFDVLLARWAGQEDVVVGAPIANRNRAETEPLIGFFVNTLVLRVDLSGNPTFLELLDRTRGVALDAYAHQDLPFEKLVEELKPPRDLSRNPLVQVIFQLFESAANPEATALQSGVSLPTQVSLFDLRVDLAPGPAGLSGRVEYDVDLFERETIEHLVDRYRRLLDQVAADPTRPIGAYELLTPDEHRLLADWNATAAPLPERPVHELIGERGSPDDVAVVWDGGALTRGELEEQSSRLASGLCGSGIGPGSVVGVCLPRDGLMVVGLLAVLKAGAAYLPLEPDLPAGRLEFMAADAGVSVVLTVSELERFVPSGVERVLLDGEWPEPGAELPAVGLDAPAWVVFTSGSTGVPKGVWGSHRGLVNRLLWGERVLGFGVGEVCVLKSRLGFVDSVAEVFGPLLAGVRLVVASEGVVGDPLGLLELVVGEGVSRVVGVPSLLRVWVEEAGGVLAGSGLRLVVCSGEELSVELAVGLRRCLPVGCRLVNVWGSTEVAADASWFELVADPVGRVPLGRPLANVRVRVLGGLGEPVPVGSVGELFVGGVGVSPGYLGWAAGERERFVEDPFLPGERLFRTGDLGRWSRRGELEFLGRVDRQLKVRGVRVEPGEVEGVLEGHSGVREAAVVARVGVEGPELAGFVVPAGVGVSGDELSAWLRHRLPVQLVPASLQVLDALPRLANGKTDLAALEALSGPRVRTRRYEAPETPTEQAVAEVFAELTHTEGVGRHDDFFELGGHSLLATRAVSRIGDRFGKTVPLRLLFEHPTVAECAAAVDAVAAATAEEAVPIVRLDRERFRATGVADS